MKKKSQAAKARLEAFKRLWNEFPGLWVACQHWHIWAIGIKSGIPIVQVLTQNVLGTICGDDEWWVASQEDGLTSQSQRVVKLDSRNLRLNRVLYEDCNTTQWTLTYIIRRHRSAVNGQDLIIYKAPRGQTINDMCLNLKTL